MLSYGLARQMPIRPAWAHASARMPHGFAVDMLFRPAAAADFRFPAHSANLHLLIFAVISLAKENVAVFRRKTPMSGYLVIA
ncbi:MAG: hypothetical protein J5838_01745, partial [Desulfovibrio sp.]|nr:hypothetical protein [Desulfovibrio sp.]